MLLSYKYNLCCFTYICTYVVLIEDW
jgi:hypothetical protein